MSDVTLFWCPQCRHCRHFAIRPTDDRVRCIPCDTFFPHEGRLFGEAEWKTTKDPFEMSAALRELREPDLRKWRLLACAIGRIEFDWCRNPWFLDALDLAERWADSGEPPRGAAECTEHFAQASTQGGRGGRESLGWVHLARRVLRDNPRLHAADHPPARQLTAALLRDFIPNPFVPPFWNPDWCTSTARDLAAHIYESRDFSAMPILADALQDADCNDKRVLNHCRAVTLHARGCWVLDAILGKD